MSSITLSIPLKADIKTNNAAEMIVTPKNEILVSIYTKLFRLREKKYLSAM